MIRHRLTVDCDHPGCPAILVGGPLQFHGSIADVDRLVSQATAMGWRYVRQTAGQPDGQGGITIEGPYHYCPTHKDSVK